MSPTSLVKANIGQALRVLLLTDTRLVPEEAELEDGGVILALRFIRISFPAVANRCVIELVEEDNLVYVDDEPAPVHVGGGEGRGEVSGGVALWAHEEFCEGSVFSASLCTKVRAEGCCYTPLCVCVSVLCATAHCLWCLFSVLHASLRVCL